MICVCVYTSGELLSRQRLNSIPDAFLKNPWLAVAATKADELVNKRLPSRVIKWKKIGAIKRNKTWAKDQMLINYSISHVVLFSSAGVLYDSTTDLFRLITPRVFNLLSSKWDDRPSLSIYTVYIYFGCSPKNRTSIRGGKRGVLCYLVATLQ